METQEQAKQSSCPAKWREILEKGTQRSRHERLSGREGGEGGQAGALPGPALRQAAAGSGEPSQVSLRAPAALLSASSISPQNSHPPLSLLPGWGWPQTRAYGHCHCKPATHHNQNPPQANDPPHTSNDPPQTAARCTPTGPVLHRAGHGPARSWAASSCWGCAKLGHLRSRAPMCEIPQPPPWHCFSCHCSLRPQSRSSQRCLPSTTLLSAHPPARGTNSPAQTCCRITPWAGKGRSSGSSSSEQGLSLLTHHSTPQLAWPH